MAQTTATGPALFQETTVQQWVSVFNKEGVHVEKTDEDKKQIHVRCIHPGHMDADASARLNLEYGNYHCWACNADRIYDPLRLLEIITNTPHKDLRGYFKDNFGINIVYKNIRAYNDTYEEDTRKLNDLVTFARWALQHMYADVIRTRAGEKSQLPISKATQPNYQKAIEWLEKKGITQADLSIFNIGLFISAGELQRWAQDWLFSQQRGIEEVPAFTDLYTMYYGKSLSSENVGALIFPHYATPKRVGRIQMRIDFLHPPVVGSTKKPLKFIFAEPHPDAPEGVRRLASTSTGFYGLDTVRHWPPAVVKDGLFLCEGATDTLAVNLAQYREHGAVLRPCIGVPGTGQSDLNSLVSVGIDKLWMLQDAAAAHGNEVAKVYLQKTKRIDLSLFQWPDSVKAHKDMDEIYHNAGPKPLLEAILADANYKGGVSFVADMFREAADGQGPEATKALLETYVGMLAGEASQRTLISTLAKEYPCIEPSDAATALVGIDDDTLEGFMRRVRRDIDATFEFLFREYDTTNPDKPVTVLTYRDEETGVIHRMPYNRQGIDTFIAIRFGGYWEWARSAKMPTHMLYRKLKKEYVLKSPTSVIGDMAPTVRAVMDQLVAELSAPEDNMYSNLYNGVHCVNSSGRQTTNRAGSSKSVKNTKILLINGPYRFLGVFHENADGTHRIEWEDYMPFLRESTINTGRMWTDHIVEISDLEEGQSVDPSGLWHALYSVFDTGWGFKDQEADCLWLTGLALYSAIYDFTERTLMTMVTGDRSSGKTKLVKDVFSGYAVPTYGMPSLPFYHYAEFPSSTPAGIEQIFSGSEGTQKRGLVLDEFENDSIKSSEKMDKFFGQFRGMLDGEANINKGTRTGKARNIVLRFPVMMSGILEFDDQTGAVDSRIFRIETVQDPTRKSPRTALRTLKIDAEKLTRNITIGMYHHALRIRELADMYALRMAEEDYGVIDGKMPESRCQKSVAVIAAIMAVCGHDDNEILHACQTLFRKFKSDADNGAEKPGDYAWNAIMSDEKPVPDGKDMGITMSSRSSLSKITLYDAIVSPQYRNFVGDQDFFPGYNVVESRNTAYLIIDHFYVRKYFQQVFNKRWDTIVKLLRRNLNVLPKARAHEIAIRVGRKFYNDSKQYIVVEIPQSMRDTMHKLDDMVGDTDAAVPGGPGRNTTDDATATTK